MSPSVVVATHKERLEHEAEMSKLNHQAELERHTSPILSAFQSNTSSRMPSYSLDGGTARSFPLLYSTSFPKDILASPWWAIFFVLVVFICVYILVGWLISALNLSKIWRLHTTNEYLL